MNSPLESLQLEHLRVLSTGAVTHVALARPERANALNYAHLHDLETLSLALRDDEDCRVVVFSGLGKHFSSGADLRDPGPEYQGSLVMQRRRRRIGERAVQAVLGIDQITIAAWQGAAVGGGACLATAMDLRVGARGCFMQYPEIDIGMNLMWKSLPLIVDLVGPARAKRLVVGGERCTDETLLEWGVLDELVPPDQLMDAANQLAEVYAAKPPVAAQMIKQSINALCSPTGDAIMHMDVDQNLLTQQKD